MAGAARLSIDRDLPARVPVLGPVGVAGQVVSIGESGGVIDSVRISFGSHFGAALVVDTAVDPGPYGLDERALQLLVWMGAAETPSADAIWSSVVVTVDEEVLEGLAARSGDLEAVAFSVAGPDGGYELTVGGRRWGLHGLRLAPTTRP